MHLMVYCEKPVTLTLGDTLMPYKPAHVANAFLWRAGQDGVSNIDQLKIQKLVYCMHGWFLATRDHPAVGELYEAWPYGPVLSSLYREFKTFGSQPITLYAKEDDPTLPDGTALMVNTEDSYFYDVFNRVWERYKGLTGLQLSALTHADGTPWSIARREGKPYLSNDLIKQHFREIAGKA